MGQGEAFFLCRNRKDRQKELIISWFLFCFVFCGDRDHIDYLPSGGIKSLQYCGPEGLQYLLLHVFIWYIGFSSLFTFTNIKDKKKKSNPSLPRTGLSLFKPVHPVCVFSFLSSKKRASFLVFRQSRVGKQVLNSKGSFLF